VGRLVRLPLGVWRACRAVAGPVAGGLPGQLPGLCRGSCPGVLPGQLPGGSGAAVAGSCWGSLGLPVAGFAQGPASRPPAAVAHPLVPPHATGGRLRGSASRRPPSKATVMAPRMAHRDGNHHGSLMAFHGSCMALHGSDRRRSISRKLVGVIRTSPLRTRPPWLPFGHDRRVSSAGVPAEHEQRSSRRPGQR
jgi:hypothetical protein